MSSTLVQDSAFARLRVRLEEEEHNGLAFAFRFRLIALGLVAVWLMFAAGPARVGIGVAACFTIMASAWLVYALRGSPYARSIQFTVTVLDVTVITVGTIVPIPGAAENGLWLEQVFGRRSLFLYLVIYLTASALSYSVRTVILTGAASLVALVGSFAWTALDQARASGIDLLGAAEIWPTARAIFARLIGPGFVTPEAFLVQQLVFMTLCTGFIAVAVWRARAHLGRTLMAEGERNNLARYFSPNLVDRLAGGSPECIFAHGGTLDKFIGDGVMATFGTPDAQPDDETRALRCALDMVRSVEAWTRGRRSRGLPAVRIAVGVHVGPVLMGAIGSRNRLEYSAVGDTVNVASRLEHLARAHDASIVASAETLAAAVNSGSFAVADSKRFRPVGAVQVPGRGEPVEVFIVPAFEAGGR